VLQKTKQERTGMKNLELDKAGTNTSQDVSRRYGTALISTLRERFGDDFAVNIPAHAKLDDVLHKLDKASLEKLAKAVSGHP
jgi:hypothetical protein